MKKSSILLIALAFLSGLALSGCGFAPVYGTWGNGDTAASLNKVAIANIPDRSGQILRNHLIDRMYHDGRPENPEAVLEVVLRENISALGVQKDATTVRNDLYLAATYVLRDNSGKILTQGTARSFVSFNKLNEQYGTLASENSARQRAITEIGEQLVNRLALYYAEQNKS